LEPLVEFIDFRRIQGQVLVDIIEPLEIVSAKIILNIYRYNTKSINSSINHIRGIPKTNYTNLYVWDESACGSKLIIEDNGKIVYAPNDCGFQNVRTKIALENKGILEWDVIVEKVSFGSWIGVCASDNFNYEIWAGVQSTGWVLGSDGSYSHSSNRIYNNYCPPFEEDGAIVTVHLNMNKRTCAFTVNGTKYPEITAWNNLPSKLYPVVSLQYPGRFRIQPHQKSI
jgi:hypothetical protein